MSAGDDSPNPTVPAASETPVAAALRTMDGIEARPLGEHPDVYQGIHATLQEALSRIDGS